MANTGTVSIKAKESFLAPAIKQHTQADVWFEVKKDSVYDGIPLDGSYQIYTNQIITKPISSESFDEVRASEPAWGVPFVFICILILIGMGFFLPDLVKTFEKKKNDD